MPEPVIGQVILALSASLLFVASVVMSIIRSTRRVTVLLLSAAGIVASVTALIWHSIQRQSWMPLDHNFDALLWLAILIALMSVYLQRRMTIGRIEWVLSPIIALLLLAAAIFGKTMPREYTHTLWASAHRIGVYTGPIALALAAASGVMYLVLNAKLRRKHSTVDARFGSLERFENLTYAAVTVGFALLTLGLITGIVRVMQHTTSLGENWYLQPKVLLSVAAYVLYALILHSPINPSFRGRRTAILSIAGFVLLLVTIGVVQIMR